MAIDIGGMLARSGATTGQLIGGGLANLGTGLGGMLTRRREQRLKEEQELKQRGMMGGMLAAQQAATEGRFDTQTMKEYIGSLQGLGVPTQQIMATIPALQQTQQAGVLNNKQNQLVGLQQQLNEQANILLESDDISRKEAANFYIDTIEEQMVEIAKDTRGIDAANFVGVGDKTRADVTRSQLAQIETNAKISGAQQQMAISALERLQFGTEAWNVKAAELEQAGFRKAVQTVRESQQKIQLANKQFEEDMSTFKNPTPTQIKEMEDGGITVPEDAVGQRQAWRTYLKSKRDKQIAAATAYLDPVTSTRAEGLVRWTMQGIAEKGDFVDIFYDDINTVIEDLTPEQLSEINSLVTGRSESEVAPIVEQWLRRNYPEPFKRSEQFVQNRQKEATAREKAIQQVLAANPPGVDEQGRKIGLDPNDPVDVRRAEQKLDESLSTERSTETGVGTPFIPATAF